MTSKSRKLPPPDVFASCPFDQKILEYYSGQFSDVFVVLHPFIKPVSIPVDRFCPSTWPSKPEMVEHCVAISWESVRSELGFDSIAALDVALRTSIGGLNAELSNEAWSQKLANYLEKNDLIAPSEGELPELLQDRLFTAIQSLGEEWLWVGDEFSSERKLVWIDDLKGENEIPSHGCLFLPNKSLLLTTHWDSHCSFLCSSREILDRVLSTDAFEGFFCAENTEVYWGAYET